MMAATGFYHCPMENEPDLARWYVCLKEMAAGGFYHCPMENGPDLACCYVCLKEMAAAVFYHCFMENEPDLARCYVCFKGMAEWKPNADPFEEQARSTECEFLRLGKKPEELTVLYFFQLEKARMQNKVRKYVAGGEGAERVA
ncbi:baculoviral IAP repeat-containing protein 5-like [Dermacentor silvarum]|uniref:baculoviral IAP repeat-containing protein 5-like n=1 Tax=Dermacentor silvarum TaxID=543639 RepID=UPI002100FC2B|nr:baculoviral IAP repeat-containing protein 5-like [Dermacentor silvarum]